MKALFRISVVLACTTVTVSGYAAPPVPAVYKTNCAPCHGVSGDANTAAGKAFNVPPFSADSVLKESDAELFTIAKNGKGKMPAWHDKLTDEQLQGLVSYIRTLHKNP